MSKRYLIFLLGLFLFATQKLKAQDFLIKGVVKEAESGITIPMALITITGTFPQTFFTDFNGGFSVRLPKGNYKIVASFTGFVSQKDSFQLSTDMEKEFLLPSEVIQLTTVEITYQPKDQNVSSTEMGKITLEIEDIKKMPAFMGEVDVLKSIQMMPGVQSAGEGSVGLYVRGGGPDQNLILVDNATVYNSGHLFGFMSVFNADAIDNVTLYKGTFPSKYGGRLSSVLAFDMKSGDDEKYKANLGIGLIASRLTIEGPIQKKKSSFIFSGRRTYIDVLTRPFFETDGIKGIPYFFYDFNGKLTFHLNEKNTLNLTGYYGDDKLNFTVLDGRFKAGIQWGNRTASANWKHSFDDHFFVNTSFNFSRYVFKGYTKYDSFDSNIKSSVTDYNLRTEFKYNHYKRHKLTFGLDYTYHVFVPRDLDFGTVGDDAVEFNDGLISIKKFVHSPSVFIDDDFEINKRIKVDVGLRFVMFQQLGPYDYVDLGENGIDTVSYGKLKNVKTYWSIEPRISGRYKLTEQSSIKAGVMYNTQYNHLMGLSGNTLPFDVWVPSSLILKPQRGIQSSLGYFRNFVENKYESSVEIYYRYMTNQTTFRDDYFFELTGEIEKAMTVGTGDAYGAEFFFRKNQGKFHGWLGYTLSYSTRRFPAINEGKQFYARYDRRHDISAVAIYDISKRLTVAANFVYGSGMAVTVQNARYFIEGQLVGVDGARNGFRMPAYHRLDVSATLKMKKRKHYQAEWALSIYNAYNRKNPYFIYFVPEGNPAGEGITVKAKQFYIFPILPSIAWNVSIY